MDGARGKEKGAAGPLDGRPLGLAEEAVVVFPDRPGTGHGLDQQETCMVGLSHRGCQQRGEDRVGVAGTGGAGAAALDGTKRSPVGREEAILAAREVLVEGGPRGARRRDDAGDAGAGVAALGSHAGHRLDQPGAGLSGGDAPAARSAFHRTSLSTPG